jgi:hypothetical protein
VTICDGVKGTRINCNFHVKHDTKQVYLCKININLKYGVLLHIFSIKKIDAFYL